jgi:putative zinc ribbon protein
VNDYCHLCYTGGGFINPGMSMQAMLNRCVSALTERGAMPEFQARAMMTEVLPHLKRWRIPVGSGY